MASAFPHGLRFTGYNPSPPNTNHQSLHTKTVDECQPGRDASTPVGGNEPMPKLDLERTVRECPHQKEPSRFYGGREFRQMMPAVKQYDVPGSGVGLCLYNSLFAGLYFMEYSGGFTDGFDLKREFVKFMQHPNAYAKFNVHASDVNDVGADEDYLRIISEWLGIRVFFYHRDNYQKRTSQACYAPSSGQHIFTLHIAKSTSSDLSGAHFFLLLPSESRMPDPNTGRFDFPIGPIGAVGGEDGGQSSERDFRYFKDHIIPQNMPYAKKFSDDQVRGALRQSNGDHDIAMVYLSEMQPAVPPPPPSAASLLQAERDLKIGNVVSLCANMSIRLSRDQARQYLSAADWNVDGAINLIIT